MNWSELPFRTRPRMLRQFAAAWLVCFLGLGAYQYFARHHPTLGLALAGSALVLGGLGLWKPASIQWLYMGAMVAALPIGWLMSQVLLAVMFYGVLTPIALYLRSRGRDLLRRRPAPDCESHWQPGDAPADPGRYLKQY